MLTQLSIESVGTLTLEAGAIRLIRKGAPTRLCRRREPLQAGDTLVAGTEARAILSLRTTQELWRLSENATIAVTAQALRLVRGAKPTRAGKLPTWSSDPGRSLPIHLASIVRGEESTLAPVGTVRHTPLELTWEREPWTTLTTVELLSLERVTLWSQQVRPAQKPAAVLPVHLLEDGAWYQVRVTQRGEGHQTQQGAPLRLLSAAQRTLLQQVERQLQSDLAPYPATRGLALGELYADYGLTSELAAALTLAFGKRKDSSEALWTLGQWYERAQQTRRARRLYQRAWDQGLRDPELKRALSQDPTRCL